ncbi:putative oxidoreductase [Christiangramia gaetbulicola]|uniref:Putative oxidoreductase n=1 Tax=Christiangramia gaetbulicola TaxID=703340 RepID=A0A2T6AIJ3_9FLAO|nr:DoxX family protein [Christiangramia gaetbulicola]PTX43626.1 putative oxidoreductase [Christiangramia gaetbulicola]
MTNKIQINRRSIQLLRILISGIFLVAGGNHLLNTEKTVRRLEQASFKGIAYFFGDPEWLVILSGIVMLAAGFLFLIGYKTRWAAIVLLLVLIPITLSVQVGQINTLGPLFKNIAILGGLLFFVMNDTDQLFKIK